MALKKIMNGFHFTKGLNQKPDKKNQSGTTAAFGQDILKAELQECNNFRFDRTGRLDKRLGYSRQDNTVPDLGTEISPNWPTLLHFEWNLANDGTGGNGTAYNGDSISWEASQSGFGQAIHMNESSPYEGWATVPNPSIGSGDCTIEMWVKMDPYTTSESRTLFCANTGYTGSNAFAAYLYWDYNSTTGRLFFQNYDGSTIREVRWEGLDFGGDNTNTSWRHILLTRSVGSSSETWELYYNGVKKSYQSGYSGVLSGLRDLDSPSGDWFIGSLYHVTSSSPVAPFKGKMDEFAIRKSNAYPLAPSSITVPSAPYSASTQTAGSISKGIALTHRGDELILFDGSKAYAQTTDEKWVDRGDVLNIRAKSNRVASNATATSTKASYGVNGNYEIIAWAEQPNASFSEIENQGHLPDVSSDMRIKYTVRDRHTGAVIIKDTVLDVYRPIGPALTSSVTASSAGTTLTGASGSLFESELATGSGDATTNGYYWVEVSDSSGNIERHRLANVASNTSATISNTTDGSGENTAFGIDVTGTAYPVHTQSDFSQYFTPRPQVVSIPGTPHVYIFSAMGSEVHYWYIDTTDGTDVNLIPVSKGKLEDLSWRHPQFVVDHWLTTATTSDSTGAEIVLTRTYATSAAQTENIYIESYEIGSDGGLTRRLQEDVLATGSHVAQYASGLEEAVSSQISMRVIHDLDSDGKPQKTDDVQVAIIFPTTSESGYRNRFLLLDHELSGDGGDDYLGSDAIGSQITEHAAAHQRSGFAFDSDNVYIMSEFRVGADWTKNTSLTREPRSYLVSTAYSRTSSYSNKYTRYLQMQTSVVSDGFVVDGTPFFWVSHASSTDRTTVTTSLIDHKGRVQANGRVGGGCVNPAVEFPGIVSDGTRGHVGGMPSINLSAQVARCLPLAYWDTGSTEYIAGSSEVELGANIFGNLINTVLDIDDGASVIPADMVWSLPALIKFDTSPTRPLRSVQAGDGLFTAGGLLWSYDGREFIENNFIDIPYIEAKLRDDGSTDTGVIGSDYYGDYTYFVVFEYTDSNGYTHQSAASEAKTVTVNASGGAGHHWVELSVWYPQITNMRDWGNGDGPIKASISVYRAFAGADEPDTFFFHGSMDIPRGGYYYDESKVGFAPKEYLGTFADRSEKALTSYQIADTPSRAAIPFPTQVALHREHLMVSTTRDKIYTSYLFDPSGVSAPQFSAFSAISPEGVPKSIHHIVSTGDQFIFFTKDDAFSIGGEGPGVDSIGGFQTPRLFIRGQGTKKGGIAAMTPAGLLFTTQAGIFSAGTHAGLFYIGEGVEDLKDLENAGDPFVLAESNEVFIPVGTNKALVYNYHFKLWYTIEIGDENHGNNGEYGTNAEWTGWVDSSGVTNIYRLNSAGRVFKQKLLTDSNPYCDTSNSLNHDFTSKVKTSWMQFPKEAGVMRLYRVMIQGEFDPDDSAATVTTKLYKDFDESSSDTHLMSGITSSSDVSSEPSELIIKPKNQKIKASQIEITMSSTPSGKGYSLSGLQFEIGIKQPKTYFKGNVSRVVAPS